MSRETPTENIPDDVARQIGLDAADKLALDDLDELRLETEKLGRLRAAAEAVIEIETKARDDAMDAVTACVWVVCMHDQDLAAAEKDLAIAIMNETQAKRCVVDLESQL